MLKNSAFFLLISGYVKSMLVHWWFPIISFPFSVNSYADCDISAISHLRSCFLSGSKSWLYFAFGRKLHCNWLQMLPKYTATSVSNQIFSYNKGISTKKNKANPHQKNKEDFPATNENIQRFNCFFWVVEIVFRISKHWALLAEQTLNYLSHKNGLEIEN